VIPTSKINVKKAWNVRMLGGGGVDFMTILVQGSYVEALLESNVIVYVKIMAQLQYAWTLILTPTAIMMNAIQSKVILIVQDSASALRSENISSETCLKNK